MSIADLLKKAQSLRLRTEMEVFLSYLLGKSRLDLIAFSEEEVPVEHLAALQQGWVKIQQGYPVAYLTNSKEFYGLDFYVDERVLIPRGATEQLVDLVKKSASIGTKVLEVGTGSGAISVALKTVRPDLKITAGDVSVDALEVAKKNAERHRADIRFIESDLLNSIPEDDFELLVANLPYIGELEHRYIDDNVEAHEPHLALFGGHDGLDLYRQLLKQAKTWNFKWIMGEFGFTHSEKMKAIVAEILPEYSYRLYQDEEGLDRIFVLEA